MLSQNVFSLIIAYSDIRKTCQVSYLCCYIVKFELQHGSKIKTSFSLMCEFNNEMLNPQTDSAIRVKPSRQTVPSWVGKGSLLWLCPPISCALKQESVNQRHDVFTTVEHQLFKQNWRNFKLGITYQLKQLILWHNGSFDSNTVKLILNLNSAFVYPKPRPRPLIFCVPRSTAKTKPHQPAINDSKIRDKHGLSSSLCTVFALWLLSKAFITAQYTEQTWAADVS